MGFEIWWVWFGVLVCYMGNFSYWVMISKGKYNGYLKNNFKGIVNFRCIKFVKWFSIVVVL